MFHASGHSRKLLHRLYCAIVNLKGYVEDEQGWR